MKFVDLYSKQLGNHFLKKEWKNIWKFTLKKTGTGNVMEYCQSGKNGNPDWYNVQSLMLLDHNPIKQTDYSL